MLVARVSMFLAASFMGSVGLFLKYLTDGIGLQVYAAVEFRGIFGIVWVTAILLASKRLRVIKDLLRYGRLVFIVTAMGVLTIFFYFMTINTAGLAIAAFLLYAGNLVAVIFMRLFLKESMPRATYLAYGLALAGVLVMEPWGDATLSWGIFTGILSAIALGFLNLSKKMLFKKNNQVFEGKAMSTTNLSFGLTWYTTLGLVITFSFSWLVDGSLMVSWNAIVVAIFLGLIPTALAFTLFNYGLTSDTGGNVLILSYAEPIMASIFQVLVFGGVPVLVLIGGALIIAGNLIALKAGNSSTER